MNKKAKAAFISMFLIMGVFLVAFAFAKPTGGPVKNSCSDTDGGIVPAVAGTTSGLLNRQPYSHTDYCADAGNVKEYYCSGTAELSVQQSCGTDGYTGSNYCSGKNVYRDYVNYSCGSGACGSTATPTLQQDCGTDTSVDFCQDGNAHTNSTLRGCSAGECTSSNTVTLKETCQYGCTNGACNPAPPAPADSCTDTDGGIIPTVNGTTYGYLAGSFYSYTDTCSSSIAVLENYCSGSGGNYNSQLSYSCGNSTNATTCINGACI